MDRLSNWAWQLWTKLCRPSNMTRCVRPWGKVSGRAQHHTYLGHPPGRWAGLVLISILLVRSRGEDITMGRYTIRRLLGLIPTLLAVYTITFVLIHATPGGPWDSDK